MRSLSPYTHTAKPYLMDNSISMQYYRKGVHPLASELQQNLLGYTGDAQRPDYREVSPIPGHATWRQMHR